MSSNDSYNQNYGVPGVVYILKNEFFRKDCIKIGCSSRSGEIRAKELNKEASTGTPAMYRCVFQYRTKDCGRAEQEVFRILAPYRRGKRNQEFFEFPIKDAKKIITQVCREPKLPPIRRRRPHKKYDISGCELKAVSQDKQKCF